MSIRVHVADAERVNVSRLDGAALDDLYDIDDVEGPVLVIEDAGNCEAIVFVGDDDELVRLAEDILERVRNTVRG